MSKTINPVTFEEKYISDFWEETFDTMDELKASVEAMEDNSRWIPSVISKEIALSAIEGPIVVPSLSEEILVHPDILLDTVTNGTMLYATVGNKSWAVRSSAKSSLFTRAGINGAALGRLAPADLAEVLNLCLNVSKGSAILLERYGKVSAFHSDASDGYLAMPISELLRITEKEVADRFGPPSFIKGTNSATYTTAHWALPEVEEELNLKYQMALMKKVGPKTDIEMEMTPYLFFGSSDTAMSSASCQPMFRKKGTNVYVHLADGIQVKHLRASGKKKDGLELYEEEVSQNLFTKFNDSIEQVERLGQVEIYNGANVVVGICNAERIPRKYGDVARETIERWSIGESCVSAYDVFMAFSEMLGECENLGASETTKSVLEEKVYKTMNPKYDWKRLDVGGVVAWAGSTQSEQQ